MTRLIRRLADGERDAADDLWPLVYDELQGMAHAQMAREGARVTLQPTALVHEAWLRLASLEELRLEERAQFFLLAGKIMRSVLVDAARARRAEKRGGGKRRVELPEEYLVELDPDGGPDVDLLALDDALGELEERDPTLARLVELRFFLGTEPPRVRGGAGSVASDGRAELAPGAGVVALAAVGVGDSGGRTAGALEEREDEEGAHGGACGACGGARRRLARAC